MTQQEIQNIKLRFGIIGQNAALNRAIEVAVQVASTDLSILVTGESGVGKEHFPKIVHEFSPRKHGPYFAVNCGAIPEGTIDSELFGHEKGAFTDAKADRKGYFEIADGGTLFLDEVGELPLQTQVRLLRVLETGEFIKMGSSKVQKTNVRVVAATNLNMKEAIANGRFREDLYYRLNAIEIHVPALRERKEDIPLLFRKFASDFSDRYRMPPIRLTEEATAELQNYYWFGNIRQLKNVAEQISVIETIREVNGQTLRRYLPENEQHQGVALLGQPTNGGDPYVNERELLYKVLFDMKRDIAELKQQIASSSTTATTATAPSTTATSTPSAPMAPQIIYPVQGGQDEVQMAEEVKEDNPLLGGTMEDAEREIIRSALVRNKGSRKMTAIELGISERTLYRKIKDYGL